MVTYLPYISMYYKVTPTLKKMAGIDEVVTTLNGADTLIVAELSRLGRSTAEITGLINALVRRQVRVIAIKQNLDIKQHEVNSH